MNHRCFVWAVVAGAGAFLLAGCTVSRARLKAELARTAALRRQLAENRKAARAERFRAAKMDANLVRSNSRILKLGRVLSGCRGKLKKCRATTGRKVSTPGLSVRRSAPGSVLSDFGIVRQAEHRGWARPVLLGGVHTKKGTLVVFSLAKKRGKRMVSAVLVHPIRRGSRPDYLGRKHNGLWLVKDRKARLEARIAPFLGFPGLYDIRVTSVTWGRARHYLEVSKHWIVRVEGYRVETVCSFEGEVGEIKGEPKVVTHRAVNAVRVKGAAGTSFVLSATITKTNYPDNSKRANPRAGAKGTRSYSIRMPSVLYEIPARGMCGGLSKRVK